MWRLSEDLDHFTCPRMVQMTAVKRYGPCHRPSRGPDGGCQKIWTTSPALVWSRRRLSEDLDHFTCPRVVQMAAVKRYGPFHLPSHGPDDDCQNYRSTYPLNCLEGWCFFHFATFDMTSYSANYKKKGCFLFIIQG